MLMRSLVMSSDRLTPQSLQRAIDIVQSSVYRPPVYVMHPARYIWYEVTMRAESWEAVKLTLAERISGAWRSALLGDTIRERLRYASSAFSARTKSVLKDEARREIEWRIAERRARYE
jgi:hypothetical protein